MTGFTPEFQAALDQFMAAAPGGGISITSGYRSPERQAQLWEQALAKYGSPEAARKWVAPPGRSNHNHGLAADLGYATPEAKAWAHENAANYGLNFPMSWEDWHIELNGARGGQPAGTSSYSATAMGSPKAAPAVPGAATGPDNALSGRLDKLALFNMLRPQEQQQSYNFLMQG